MNRLAGHRVATESRPGFPVRSGSGAQIRHENAIAKNVALPEGPGSPEIPSARKRAAPSNRLHPEHLRSFRASLEMRGPNCPYDGLEVIKMNAVAEPRPFASQTESDAPATPRKLPAAGARAPDPEASASGTHDCPQDSWPLARNREPRRSGVHRYLGAHIRHRPFRPITRHPAEDLRRAQDQRSDFGQPAPAGLGASPAAQARQADSKPRSPRRSSACCAPPTKEEIAAELNLTLDAYHQWQVEIRGRGPRKAWSRRDPMIPRIAICSASFQTMQTSGPPRCSSAKNCSAPWRRPSPESRHIEKTVLSLYYHDELTLREIAKIVGLHESRISQIKTQAVLRLRVCMAELWPAAGYRPIRRGVYSIAGSVGHQTCPDAPFRPADGGQHHVDFLAVPHHHDGYRTAAQSPQVSGNIRGRGHFGVVHAHDHVSGFDAGIVRGGPAASPCEPERLPSRRRTRPVGRRALRPRCPASCCARSCGSAAYPGSGIRTGSGREPESAGR